MEGKEHEIATTFGEEVTTNEEFVKFDPSRMIGIIKRRALIKDLAAAYHAECIACGQELLHLQKKWEETAERRAPEEIRKRLKRPTKRAKKEH